jgi:hypothetical protein
VGQKQTSAHVRASRLERVTRDLLRALDGLTDAAPDDAARAAD